MSEDAFQVDIEGLKATGVPLGEIQDSSNRFAKRLADLRSLIDFALGPPNDPLGGPARRSITPVMEQAGQVLTGLGELANGHVGQIGDVASLTNTINSDATQTAGHRV
jgi:hypothetical protein